MSKVGQVIMNNKGRIVKVILGVTAGLLIASLGNKKDAPEEEVFDVDVTTDDTALTDTDE